jgi:hypothetical protein
LLAAVKGPAVALERAKGTADEHSRGRTGRARCREPGLSLPDLVLWAEPVCEVWEMIRLGAMNKPATNSSDIIHQSLGWLNAKISGRAKADRHHPQNQGESVVL